MSTLPLLWVWSSPRWLSSRLTSILPLRSLLFGAVCKGRWSVRCLSTESCVQGLPSNLYSYKCTSLAHRGDNLDRYLWVVSSCCSGSLIFIGTVDYYYPSEARYYKCTSLAHKGDNLDRYQYLFVVSRWLFWVPYFYRYSRLLLPIRSKILQVHRHSRRKNLLKRTFPSDAIHTFCRKWLPPKQPPWRNIYLKPQNRLSERCVWVF
jgi:hypothetical protein